MPDAPSDAPRPLTPLASRRAWTEPRVRLWWLMAAAVLLAILAYAGDRLWDRRAENQLIANGVPVTATVVSTEQHATAGQTAAVDEPVTIGFAWHGKPVNAQGTLTRPSFIGRTVDVHVDPADPTNWTDRTAPTPLSDALFVGLLLLPIAPVLLGVAWLARRSVVRTYRTGASAVAVVSARRQVPIAPLSHAVRCSFRDGTDRRLHTVYVPRGGGRLAKGDVLWVVLPPRRGKPVAAMWFE